MQSEFVSSLFEWVAAHPGWMSTVIFLPDVILDHRRHHPPALWSCSVWAR